MTCYQNRAGFSKVPKSFSTRKDVAISQTLSLQGCFIYMIWQEVPFIQQVSGMHLSVFRYGWTKNGFPGLKRFRDFRETGRKHSTSETTVGDIFSRKEKTNRSQGLFPHVWCYRQQWIEVLFMNLDRILQASWDRNDSILMQSILLPTCPMPQSNIFKKWCFMFFSVFPKAISVFICIASCDESWDPFCATCSVQGQD